MARKSNPQIWIEYALAKAILVFLAILPRGVAIAFGFSVAAVGYRVLGKLRRVGLRSLELAYPERTGIERNALLKGSFRNLGRTLGVVGGFANVTRENINDLIEIEFDPEFEAEFARIRESKRGILILTGHIGNWELFALAYSMFFGPANLLSRKMDNPKIDAMVESLRSSFGNRQIDKINSAGPILRILNKGGTVGILADVNTHPKEGVFVPFYGIQACTTAGVAMLAQRANAVIVPLFAVWNEEKGKYTMINAKIIEPANTGDRKADIETTTAEFTAALERVIRKYPDQWNWIHRRWKTRPPGEPELYDNI
ncbi:MAG: lysophospholipid acyltransferase family protein [Pyrinomonadaceae bacterium]